MIIKRMALRCNSPMYDDESHYFSVPIRTSQPTFRLWPGGRQPWTRYKAHRLRSTYLSLKYNILYFLPNQYPHQLFISCLYIMRSFFAILSAFILIGIDTSFRFTATAVASPIPKNIDKPKGVAFCHAHRGDDDACPVRSLYSTIFYWSCDIHHWSNQICLCVLIICHLFSLPQQPFSRCAGVNCAEVSNPSEYILFLIRFLSLNFSHPFFFDILLLQQKYFKKTPKKRIYQYMNKLITGEHTGIYKRSRSTSYSKRALRHPAFNGRRESAGCDNH